MNRRPSGRETWHRLRDWDKGQADSERLAARLLAIEGYENIDPSHPLGGKDKGKDALCRKDGRSTVIAVYFPRGQQAMKAITDKFTADLDAAKGLGAEGFTFVTNQELPLGEREALEDLGKPLAVEIFHLERLAASLDTPRGYGLRLEFLSIDMTREEQVSFFNDRDQVLYEIREQVVSLVHKKKQGAGIATVAVEYPNAQFQMGIFDSKLVECKNCGEVFRARKFPNVFAYSGTLATVKCPSCGKVQTYPDGG